MTSKLDQPREREGVSEVGERQTVANVDPIQLLRERPTFQNDDVFSRYFPTGGVSADGSLTFGPEQKNRMQFDPKGQPEGQLKQFADLYAQGKPDARGQVHAQIEVNGGLQDVTISRNKMGSANLMQVTDANGRVMMRALERNGEWQHQRGAKGAEVSYFGKYYSDGQAPSDVAQNTQPARHERERRRDGDQNSADRPADVPPGGTDTDSSGRVVGEWNRVKLTAYFNGRGAGNGEGGPKDERGNYLYSVEQFLKDPSRPVSVAVDRDHMPRYGQQLSIPELDKKFAKELNQLVAEGKLTEPKFRFSAVDNGPAVQGKRHVDICLARYKSSRFPDVDLARNATVQIIDSRNRV